MEVEKLKSRRCAESPVRLAGDGQFDSPGELLQYTIIEYCNISIPGFTAAYCSYSVQDLDTKKIIGLYVAEKKMVNDARG